MSYAPIEALACDGRLTLLSVTPVPTTDQLSKTTVYFTPFRGNRIALYDGDSSWVLRTFSELSVAVPATTNTNFDVFAYDNAGAVGLETVNWTNDITRATALTTQNGVLVKSGATTRRYLGTGRTTGASGQTEDSYKGNHQSGGRRLLWNYYNRVLWHLAVIDTTDNWTYTTAAWRQANGNVGNLVDCVIGWPEDVVTAEIYAFLANSNASGVVAGVGVGVDSATANSAKLMQPTQVFSAAPIQAAVAQYQGILAAGYHYLSWLERSGATAVTTWYGDAGIATCQSGLQAEVWG